METITHTVVNKSIQKPLIHDRWISAFTDCMAGKKKLLEAVKITGGNEIEKLFN